MPFFQEYSTVDTDNQVRIKFFSEPDPVDYIYRYFSAIYTWLNVFVNQLSVILWDCYRTVASDSILSKLLVIRLKMRQFIEHVVFPLLSDINRYAAVACNWLVGYGRKITS